jgi:hypothetical protein
MLLASFAGGLANFGWALALGFSLAVVMLYSLLVVASYPREALSLTVDPRRARAFKGEEVAVEVVLASKWRGSLAEFEVVSVPEGLELAMRGEKNRRTLTAGSRYAGVFSGVKAKMGVVEPMGIFERSEVHRLDLSFEFLPTFLLAKREPVTVSAVILGDYPAGRRGFGQEFHSVEAYTPSSSSRDILWKKLAKTPGEELMARVGEANIPEKLTVCFIEREGVGERGSPRWMDLASEAIARVGLPVISTGTRLRVLHVLGGTMEVAEAKEAEGLANILVGLWTDKGLKEKTMEGPDQADIIVTAEAETTSPETMALVLEKPTVLLAWTQQKKVARGSRVVFFTGHEDVSGLVMRVLSR